MIRSILVITIFSVVCSLGLAQGRAPLTADADLLSSVTGGEVTFTLNAGIANKGRCYAILGTVSGTSPGIPLPGGAVVLPINWDVTTPFFLTAFPSLFGVLDNTGKSSSQIAFSQNLRILQDVTLHFAYALQGPPWDYVSNPVKLTLKANPHLSACGDLIGWSKGGELCWVQGFDIGPTPTYINGVSAVFGSKNNPGKGPKNGTPFSVYMWDDPNKDMDPSDAVLMHVTSGVVVNTDTGVYNLINFNTHIKISGTFFVGCSLMPNTGEYATQMILPGVSPCSAWLAGDPGGIFNPAFIGPLIFNMKKSGINANFYLTPEPE